MSRSAPDIALLASFSGEGGVERMLLNLINAFAGRGLQVHLLLIKTRSRHLSELHPAIRLIELGSRHTATSLLPLIRYLRSYRPPRLLVAKDRAGRLAVLARLFAGTSTRLVVRLGTNLSAAHGRASVAGAGRPGATAAHGRASVAGAGRPGATAAHGRASVPCRDAQMPREAGGRKRPSGASIKFWLRRVPIRLLYPYIDRIVAVSEGVKRDTVALAGIDPSRIEVVRNPVLTPRLLELAREPTPHPWLDAPDTPVILGAGRLTAQKDFTTLLRAFARLCETRACRLIILGDGRQEATLKALAAELGVAETVSFPGFTDNPYAYMARADLFVLSSRWEGSPNVLTEAMVLGTPVVSTDCPSGPQEILDGGRYGPLVPVGDWRALADAMTQVLETPTDSDSLREAVQEYRVETSASHYLEILGIPQEPTDAAVD